MTITIKEIEELLDAKPNSYLAKRFKKEIKIAELEEEIYGPETTHTWASLLEIKNR